MGGLINPNLSLTTSKILFAVVIGLICNHRGQLHIKQTKNIFPRESNSFLTLWHQTHSMCIK